MTTAARARAPRPAVQAASAAHGAAARLRGGFGREVVTFAVIGAVSTAAYAVLYLALRSPVGPTAANAAALVITAVGNTAANRRLTFGVRDRHSMLRDQLGGLLALAVAIAITTAAVSLLGAVAPAAGRVIELAVLVVANALATVARFVLLRTLVGGRRPTSRPAAAGDTSPT